MPPPTLLRLPPLPPVITTLTNAEAIALNERYPKSQTTVENCVTCKGRRQFEWLADDRVTVVEYECPCRDQYVLSRWLWHCGILMRWQRLGWPDLAYLPDEAVTAAMDYWDNLDIYRDNGIGLVLTGPKGTGKTLFAHLILKEAIIKGADVYATTFNQMIDEFAGGWRDKSQAIWFNNRVRDAGLLFIDDLGRERNTGRGPGENMLETVVRHRNSCLLPTIITTNIDHDQIETAYGGHTFSLLSEVAIHLPVLGTDRRVEIRAREMDIIRRGLVRPVVLR